MRMDTIATSDERDSDTQIITRQSCLTDRCSSGHWHGTMQGEVQGTKVSWKLAFDLNPIGSQCIGKGYLSGSATLKSSLVFTITADSTNPDDATMMIITLLDPLPNGENNNYPQFALTGLTMPGPDRIEATFHLLCMYPMTCGCSGGLGTFRAQKS